MRVSLSFLAATAAATALLSAPAPVDAATSCTTQGTKHTGAAGRSYTTYAFPSASYGPNGGWKSLPGSNKVCGANLHRNLKLPKASSQLTVPVYESAIDNPAGVLRVVIGTEAKGRDGWTYWTSLNNAKKKAYADNSYISSHQQIAVIVPQFLGPKDRADGSATETDLLFHGNDWADGQNGINPKKLGAESVSSFDVIDAIVSYIGTKYPNAQRIVFGGHSMGAQFVHRYTALRKEGQRDMHFVAMNPGTWLYFNHSRISWNDKANCPAYDDYKMGISQRTGASPLPAYAASDIARLGRTGLTTRIADRRLHLLVGSNDNGSGDYSCEAKAQGTSHRNRGQRYLQSVIQSLPANNAALQRAGGARVLNGSQGPGKAGVPQKWTWDVVSPCTHNEVCMFNSVQGQKRLYLDGFPRGGARRDVDDDDDEEVLETRTGSFMARMHAKPHVRAVHHA
ncbi:hypothetical protein CF327_g1609 [Tilletia walkeri]|uniref:Uncharacterized protein n=1 Tax=Tilletia walkeri TaxID=117179 RepID=A0A8X7N607_9BASI|nr:hypothetical protein CF327_g1609 [Tilletia walkeri]KAE8267826.1 hypothetical protein A4X09_0g4523 [Tilletia walkeri]